MPNISHEEIVQKFLHSKSIDFNALGKFVAEFGPQIVAAGRGDYGIRFGHYNLLACFYINPVERLGVGSIGATGIASEVAGRSIGAAAR